MAPIATFRNTNTAKVARGERIPPTHPGETLLEDYIRPLELTAYKVAKAMGVGQSRLSLILRGHRSITADTALRLARVFSTSPDYWLGLQNAYDLAVARDELDVDALACLYEPTRLEGVSDSDWSGGPRVDGG